MSDFFPDPPKPPPEDLDEPPQPVWLNPPDDVLPGIVPIELILGRSDQAVAMLAGLLAFPTGVALTLLIRTRGGRPGFDLNDEVFDGPYRHDQDDAWRRDRLKWGFEYADGRRVTSVDPWPALDDPSGVPDRPVLSGGGGGGGARSVDRRYWLWPLPPPGELTIVFQWPNLGICQTTTRINADQINAAAARAQPIWPLD